MHDWTAVKQIIRDAERILIFTHAGMDGDAAGTSCAFAKSLRAMGKEAFVLLEDDCPEYLLFTDGEGCFVKEAPWPHDLSIAVDIGGYDRLGERAGAFDAARAKICIDHHIKTCGFVEPSVVDTDAPAAGSLVFELLKDMGAPIDKGIAEDLYVAIATDTGSFRYANCSAEAHMDTAELYSYGIDHARLCNAIWGSYPLPQLLLEAVAVERAVIFAGGKAALSWSTLEDLRRFSALEEHAECCVDRIRSIQGVEAAAFIKEKPDGSLKVSFRSKSYADVNAAARALGGGGHLRASGCTLRTSLSEAAELVKAELEKSV